MRIFFLIFFLCFTGKSFALECPKELHQLCLLYQEITIHGAFSATPGPTRSRSEIAKIFITGALNAYNKEVDPHATIIPEVPCSTTVHSEMLKNNIGLLTITLFRCDVVHEVEHALTEFTQKGVDGIIINLLGNFGGKTTLARDVASLFIGPDKMFATLVSNNDTLEIKTLPDAERIVNEAMRIYILINKNTASSAELFVDALRTYMKKTRLIGGKTHGKNTFQIEIIEDGMVRIHTGGTVLSASGNSGGGIIPDHHWYMSDVQKYIDAAQLMLLLDRTIDIQ